jgi:hypothetical protein
MIGGQESMRIGFTFFILIFVSFAGLSGCSEGRMVGLERKSSSVDKDKKGDDDIKDDEGKEEPTKPAYATWGKGGIDGVGQGQIFEKSFSSDAASRYYIYVPQSYQEDAPMGVALLFHGVEGTNNPNAMIRISQAVSGDRFILISPVGDISFGGSGAWCQPFTREIHQLVKEKYNVDLRRQYVAGLSGGGQPAILYGLGNNNGTYSYCGRSIPYGFQEEFAAFGFTASAYEPSQFSFLKAVTSGDLGFQQRIWADFGENSSDRDEAESLAEWGRQHSWDVDLVMRPGEGHSPESPYSFMGQMFDMFANTIKPITAFSAQGGEQ